MSLMDSLEAPTTMEVKNNVNVRNGTQIKGIKVRGYADSYEDQMRIGIIKI